MTDIFVPKSKTKNDLLARDVIYSRLCYDVSVRLSVTFVHCGHRVQWILDTFACLDRCMSLLLTDNASPGSSDGMMPGFLVEEGRGHLALSWPLLGPLVIFSNEFCYCRHIHVNYHYRPTFRYSLSCTHFVHL